MFVTAAAIDYSAISKNTHIQLMTHEGYDIHLSETNLFSGDTTLYICKGDY